MNERLKEWAIDFLKHKDIFVKNLEDISNNEFGFDAKFKDKTEKYIIQENLELNDIPKEGNVCYITLNNQKNFTKLLTEWKIVIAFKNLKIIFVEKISNGQHWTIIPYMHDKISDKTSLKIGLKSLYEAVKNA